MKKPFKITAYSGLAYLVCLFLIFIFPSLFYTETLGGKLFSLIQVGVSVLFSFGTIMLGKRFKSKLLVRMSYIVIMTNILLLLFSLFPSFFVGNEALQSFDIKNPAFDQAPSSFKYFLSTFWIISIVLGIVSILFGVALIKISKNIKYAKSAGVLNIIAGATLIILIGYLIMIAAIIMEILLLFEASEKFEERDNKKKKRK